MFKEWQILSFADFDEVIRINNAHNTIASYNKPKEYDKEFEEWMKEYLDPDVDRCFCIGRYIDNVLAAYYTLSILEHWPFAYHDHWRTNSELPNRSIRLLLSSVPELHDFLVSKKIYTWFSLSGKKHWDQYVKIKPKYLSDDINATVIETIEPNNKSNYAAFNKYFSHGKVYTVPMYVVQHTSTRKQEIKDV